MNKSKMSIDRINRECSVITYDEMRVSRVAPIEIRDNRYRFINGRKSLLLYFGFFDICDRSKYNTNKSSPKRKSTSPIKQKTARHSSSSLLP